MSYDPKKLLDGGTIKKFKHGQRWSKLGDDGKPIYTPECELEGKLLSFSQVNYEGTLGRFGPNGNGYNYWCKKCAYRCTPADNTYSALAALMG